MQDLETSRQAVKWGRNLSKGQNMKRSLWISVSGEICPYPQKRTKTGMLCVFDTPETVQFWIQTGRCTQSVNRLQPGLSMRHNCITILFLDTHQYCERRASFTHIMLSIQQRSNSWCFFLNKTVWIQPHDLLLHSWPSQPVACTHCNR